MLRPFSWLQRQPQMKPSRASGAGPGRVGQALGPSRTQVFADGAETPGPLLRCDTSFGPAWALSGSCPQDGRRNVLGIERVGKGEYGLHYNALGLCGHTSLRDGEGPGNCNS